MVTLKMSNEDSKLLLDTIVDYTLHHTPMKYGGNFKENPKLNEEQWLRLRDLINILDNQNTK
jgi:hypothetical protein